MAWTPDSEGGWPPEARSGAIFSAALHATVVAVATLGLPLLERKPPESLPVIALQFEQIAEKSNPPPPKPAPQAKLEPPRPEPPKPEPRPEVAKPEPPKPEPPKPEAAKVEPKPEPRPEPPKAEARPEPKPEPPKPEPPKAEARPEPKPEPPKPEPKLAELPPEPEPLPLARPKEPPKPVEPPPVPQATPVPKAKPAPKEAKPEPKEPEFNPERLAALLNKLPKTAAAPIPVAPTAQPAPQRPSSAPSSLDQPLTMSELDAVRSQIERNWSVPAGARDAENLVVRIRILLNPDGSIRGTPEIMDQGRYGRAGQEFYQAAAESALRAVLRSQPLQLPPGKYERWREIELTFNPKDMLGG